MPDAILLHLILFSLAVSVKEDLDSKRVAQEIKKGNHSAFRTFFEAHHEHLYRFLRSKNIAAQTAEDLIQRAFVYIWENRSSIDPQKSLKAYLFRIAYTRMLNHIRDNGKFDESQAVPERETNLTPEDTVRAADLEQAISDTLKSMPEKRSRVFELCFIEQFTYKEAAEVLEIKVKTVENHMGLALKDMRKALHNFI